MVFLSKKLSPNSLIQTINSQDRGTKTLKLLKSSEGHGVSYLVKIIRGRNINS